MTKISNYYDHELDQFYDAMRLKLHIHRQKGKWEGLDLNMLFQKLVGEVEELKETIEDGNQIAMILEAADVANYAMIIANVAMKIAVQGDPLCQDSLPVNTPISPSSQGGQSSVQLDNKMSQSILSSSPSSQSSSPDSSGGQGITIS